MDARVILQLLIRRARWVGLCVMAGAVLGVLVAKLVPVTYIAAARLLVESEQIPDSMAISTVKTSAAEQVQIITQRILTRDMLVELAHREGIYGSDSAEISANADKIVEDLRARITIEIMANPTTNGAKKNEPQATIVNVAFQAGTATLAASVANEIVTRILREDVMMRTGEARQTLEFFQQEVDRLDAELKTRAAEILAFKASNSEALPDALEERRTRVLALEARAEATAEREEELRAALSLLERRHAAADLADPSRVKAVTVEVRKLAELEAARLELIRALPLEDPKVVTMSDEIDDLRAAVLKAQGQGARPSAYEMRRREMLSTLDIVAQSRYDTGRELAAMKAMIAATPANSVTLDSLQRDYETLRAQYDTAVANRAMAETGDTIETLSKGQRISVIEQATAPAKAAKPNRRMIALAGLLLGMIAGAASTLAEPLLRPTLRRPEDLAQGLGISPFATIPYLTTAVEAYEEKRQIRLWGIGFAVLVLLILVAIATLFDAPEVAELATIRRI